MIMIDVSVTCSMLPASLWLGTMTNSKACISVVLLLIVAIFFNTSLVSASLLVRIVKSKNKNLLLFLLVMTFGLRKIICI